MVLKGCPVQYCCSTVVVRLASEFVLEQGAAVAWESSRFTVVGLDYADEGSYRMSPELDQVGCSLAWLRAMVSDFLF